MKIYFDKNGFFVTFNGDRTPQWAKRIAKYGDAIKEAKLLGATYIVYCGQWMPHRMPK